MKQDDILWKSILEDMFDDFLRFFFEDADQLFDMEKEFTFLDKELSDIIPAEDMRSPKHVDKLVKVFTRGRNEDFVLFHIEVQGYVDVDFESRMFTYAYRIFDKLGKPVIAISILTDNRERFRPVAFRYSFFGKTSLDYQFATYKVLDQNEADLRLNTNPFSVVILTVLLALKRNKLKDPELLRLKVDLAKHLLQRKMPVKKQRSLMRFLKYYARFHEKETNRTFDSIIYTITNKKETMGIEEFMLDRAKKEGIEEGRREEHRQNIHYFVTSLLLNTDLTIAKIASLANVSEYFVRKLKKVVI